MKKRDEVLRFLLPDLLGKPSGLTDKEGNLIFPSEFEIPPDNYIFLIPVKEWKDSCTCNCLNTFSAHYTVASGGARHTEGSIITEKAQGEEVSLYIKSEL